MTATTTAPDSTALVARATAYLSLARALADPTDTFLADLESGDFLARLRAAVAVADEECDLTAACDRLARAVEEVRASPLALAEEYTYLFARQVLVPPYESSYDRDPAASRVRILQEVGHYYTAFGLRVDPDHPNLPDHIGAELEFLGLLCAKQAYAREAGLVEPATICDEARARFAGDHLMGWLPEFGRRLEARARLAFYPAVSALVLALLHGEPVTGPITAPETGAPVLVDEEESFSCGVVPGAPASREEF